MQKRQVLGSLTLLALVAVLTIVVAGIASGKAHVPANQVQVCHKGTALSVDAPALKGHAGHGDIRLPACDFDQVFLDGFDCSGVIDANGDGLADLPAPGSISLGTGNACGVSTFCPAGGPTGPKPAVCF